MQESQQIEPETIMRKLELLSNQLRSEINNLEIAFTKAEPMANHFGYTFCRKTGNLIKK